MFLGSGLLIFIVLGIGFVSYVFIGFVVGLFFVLFGCNEVEFDGEEDIVRLRGYEKLRVQVLEMGVFREICGCEYLVVIDEWVEFLDSN